MAKKLAILDLKETNTASGFVGLGAKAGRIFQKVGTVETLLTLEGHAHKWTQITDKPETFAPTLHTHPATEITDTVAKVMMTVAERNKLGLLSNYTLTKEKIEAVLTGNITTHTHSIAQITGLQGALNAKATPADISTAINGIEIGGRNYILESLMATISNFTTGFDLKGKWYQFSTGVRTITNLDVFEEETSYVLSFEFVAVDGSSASPYFRIRYTDGTFSPYLHNGHSPFVTNANKTVRTVETTYGTYGVARVYNLKFEKGNKATDWTPTPEDVDAGINLVQTNLNSHTSLINNPHSVTKAQVGLGSVNNTADSAKNVLSATKLTTAININGTSFNGLASITTARWGTARNIGIVNSDGSGTAVVTSVNGSDNINLKLPSTIKASLTGNASSASTVSTSAENTGTTSRYILFANSASGNQALKTDSGLKYVPGTNTITATLAGKATSAGNADTFNNYSTDGHMLYKYTASLSINSPVAKTVWVKLRDSIVDGVINYKLVSNWNNQVSTVYASIYNYTWNAAAVIKVDGIRQNGFCVDEIRIVVGSSSYKRDIWVKLSIRENAGSLTVYSNQTIPSLVESSSEPSGDIIRSTGSFSSRNTFTSFSGAIYTDIIGNASTATKLQTARNIAGVSFNGTENIAIPFANLASKPTTLSGYGITDGVTSNTTQTISGGKTFSKLITANAGISTTTLIASGIITAKDGNSTNWNTAYAHTSLKTNPHETTKAHVGLGNVTNESKATMFASPTFTGTVKGVTKAHVGLGNVNNTSDANKPISTATQTALNGKLNLTGGTLGNTAKLEIRNYSVGIPNVLQLTNNSSSGRQGTSIFFKGYFNQALISSSQNPTIVQGGDLHLQTYSNDSVLNTGIYLNRTGYVGVNTINPSYNLDVSGTGRFTGNVTAGNITPSATIAHNIGTSSLMYERAYLRNIDTQSGYRLRFNVAGSEYMTIQKSGNVGIGTTSPAYKLDVAGSIASTGGSGGRYSVMSPSGLNSYGATGGWVQGHHFYLNNDTALGGSAGAYGGTSSLNYFFYGGTYLDPSMAILPNKNVGIGTTSPAYKLDVSGTGRFTGNVTASTGVNTPKVDFGNGFTIEPSGTELVFKFNNVIKQRMLSDGSIVAAGEVTAITE